MRKGKTDLTYLQVNKTPIPWSPMSPPRAGQPQEHLPYFSYCPLVPKKPQSMWVSRQASGQLRLQELTVPPTLISDLETLGVVCPVPS